MEEIIFDEEIRYKRNATLILKKINGVEYLEFDTADGEYGKGIISLKELKRLIIEYEISK